MTPDPRLPPHTDWAAWALAHLQDLPALTGRQWELIVVQARQADVLARLAAWLQQAGQLDAVPQAPRAHLLGALNVAAAQHAEVWQEARYIDAALQHLGVPVALLKGSAYVVSGSAAALGRLFSDTDILIPKDSLSPVERGLMMAGWLGTNHDSYDQHYYRQWMHEIPPMGHLSRGTTIDVHHNILPLTVRRPPDAALLLASARALPGFACLHSLTPTDQVLHSMAHLFHNDDLSHGLRDVSDLDMLLRAQLADQGAACWPGLLSRAQALHVEMPLAYGLWACQALLGTPVPDEVITQARAQAGIGRVHWAAMCWLWRRVLRTAHSQARLGGQGLAGFALYVRAHWLRMPPLLLARHLSIKAWKRLTAPKPAAVPGQGPA